VLPSVTHPCEDRTLPRHLRAHPEVVLLPLLLLRALRHVVAAGGGRGRRRRRRRCPAYLGRATAAAAANTAAAAAAAVRRLGLDGKGGDASRDVRLGFDALSDALVDEPRERHVAARAREVGGAHEAWVRGWRAAHEPQVGAAMLMQKEQERLVLCRDGEVDHRAAVPANRDASTQAEQRHSGTAVALSSNGGTVLVEDGREVAEVDLMRR
jgi:hypothetical protein